MAHSNTVPKQLKPFTKGDPRINRNGRPKVFDMLREIGQRIAQEEITAKDGRVMTVAEAVMRQWFTSKEFQKQKQAMEITFGKVPDQMEISGQNGDRLIIQVNYGNESGSESPEVSSETEGDSTKSETL